MKLNKKIFVTSLLLMGLSTVAMSTATYAWFTVNKTASMTASATIKSEAGVEVGLVASGGHDAKDYEEEATIDLGSHSMTDISGNGASLFRPIFASNNKDFSSVTTITENGLSGYEDTFIVAQLKFRSDKAYNVYVGQSADILSGGLADAVRLAIFDSGTEHNPVNPSTSTLRQFIYSGSIENEYYISANTATSVTTNNDGVAATGYTAVSNFDTLDAASDDDRLYHTVISDVVSEYTTLDDANAHLNPLTTLTKDGKYPTGHKFADQDAFTGCITVVIWVEGADKDCINDNINKSLTVDLRFAFLLA